MITSSWVTRWFMRYVVENEHKCHVSAAGDYESGWFKTFALGTMTSPDVFSSECTPPPDVAQTSSVRRRADGHSCFFVKTFFCPRLFSLLSLCLIKSSL